MKKFLSAIILTSILLGTVLAPMPVSAAEKSTPFLSTLKSVLSKTINNTSAELAKRREGSLIGNFIGSGCVSLTKFSMSNCIQAAIASVGDVIVSMFGIVLYITNEIFNFVVTWSIRDFSDLANMDAVKDAWRAVRDITNIFFIFVLLYIAIGTMFQLFGAKQLLTRVIIVALLINFSAVLPKVVIDASNLLALEFYDRIGDGTTAGTGAPDITKVIVQNLGFFHASSDSTTNQDKQSVLPRNTHLAIIVSIFGKIILILTTAFLLAAAAWMFIWRTVVLLFIIILSPIAIFAAILPKTKKHFDDWLDRLINESFFAPAYLFMLYISVSVIKGINLSDTGSNEPQSKLGYFFSAIGQNPADLIGWDVIKVALNFVIIIFFLASSLIIARSMGNKAAAQVSGWGKSLRGLALGATVGTAGAYTLGKAAKAAAESTWMKNKSASSPFLGGLARDTLNKIAGQKYAGGASYTERVEKAAKRIEGFKTPELQAQYLASLSEIDRKAAYKNLSDRQKAELHEYTDEQLNTLTTGAGGTSANANLISNYRKVSAIKPKTGTEDYEKLEAEKKKIIDRKNTQEAIDALKAAPVAPLPPPGTPPPIPGSPPVPPTPQQIKLQRQQSLGKIRGKNINKIDVATLVKPDVAPYFSIQHLAALKDHPEMDQTHRDAIRSAIEAAVGVTAANRTPTIGAPEQQKVYNWLETGGGVDF